jgi:hypothetical protein
MEAARQIAFGTIDELVVLSGTGHGSGETRAFVLDTASGSLVAKKEWREKYVGHSSIFASARGIYLTSGLDGPVAYSAGLREQLPKPPEYVENLSQDGRYFTISKGERGRAVQAIVDIETFRETGVEVVNTSVDSIGSNRLASVVLLPDDQGAVKVADSTGTLYPFTGPCRAIRPRFVAPDVVAVFGCHRLEVVTLSGERLFGTGLEPEDRYVAAAARDGSRFATIAPHFGIGCDGKVCFETVRVFDIAARREVFSTEVHEWHGTDGGSGIALSPDGLALAVNSVGIVRYFRLPPKVVPQETPSTVPGEKS